MRWLAISGEARCVRASSVSTAASTKIFFIFSGSFHFFIPISPTWTPSRTKTNKKVLDGRPKGGAEWRKSQQDLVEEVGGLSLAVGLAEELDGVGDLAALEQPVGVRRQPRADVGHVHLLGQVQRRVPLVQADARVDGRLHLIALTSQRCPRIIKVE